jgi:hypothetical protein
MRNEYRILQDGMTVATSTSLADILHYAIVYGQDGPATVQERINGRWRTVPEGIAPNPRRSGDET